MGLQDLLFGIRSQTPNAAWVGTPRSLLGAISCNYFNREWGGTPKSPLGKKPSQCHNRAWGGTPRPPLWYTRYSWSEVGLQELHCGSPFLWYVRWDSKTVAWIMLFSIVREVGLRHRRLTQLFHAKTDQENFPESFTLNLLPLYLTVSSRIAINLAAEHLFFVPLCYMLFNVILINSKFYTRIYSLIRGA